MFQSAYDFPPCHFAHEATLWAARPRSPAVEWLPASAPRTHHVKRLGAVEALSRPGSFLRRSAYHLKILGFVKTFADLEQPTGYDGWNTANVQDGMGARLVEEHGIPSAFS